MLALCLASSFSNIRVAKILVESGKVNVDQRCLKEQTALHFAGKNNYTEIVEFLIENGADVNVQDDTGIVFDAYIVLYVILVI